MRKVLRLHVDSRFAAANKGGCVMIVKPALARGGRDNKIPSVKLLETVTGLFGTGVGCDGRARHGSDGTSDEQSNRRDSNRGRAIVFQRTGSCPIAGPILWQRDFELFGQHLLQ